MVQDKWTSIMRSCISAVNLFELPKSGDKSLESSFAYVENVGQ